MAYTSRLRTVGKLTGVAALAAPYVRRVATDDELRDDVSDFLRSANDLVQHLSSDGRLRKDLQRMMDSAQSSAGHMRSDIRPRHFVRNLVVGAGMMMLGTGIVIALAWPRTRQGVLQIADQTASRANATVHDVRERISGQKDVQAA